MLVVLSILLQPLAGLAAADISKDYTLEWTDTVNTANGVPSGVAMDSSGNIYVVQKETQTDQTLTVVKYDSSGNVQWSKEYGTTGLGNTAEEQIAVNGDGVYVADAADGNVYMINKSDGSTIDTGSISFSNDDEEVAADTGFVTVEEQGQDTQQDWYVFETDSTGLTLNNTLSDSDGPWTIAIDNEGDTYITRGGSGVDVEKWDTSDTQLWGTGPGWLPSGGSTIVLNGDGSGTDAYVGQEGGQVTEVLIAPDDTFNSRGWETSPTAGSTRVTASTYIENYQAIAVGDGEGNVYVMNESDGSTAETFAFTDLSDITGVASNGNNLAMIQADGSLRYYSVPPDVTTTSIDLTINDKTLIPPESSSYTVTATLSDSSTSDVTSSSNVASDDTTVVSVDEVNAEIDYQGDGTTVVRANYTNSTGAVLWDNETVETDTPQIDLTLEHNPLTYGHSHNYTVTRTVFGSTTDITGVANVSSDNSSILLVNESAQTYEGVSEGFANMTANNTVNGIVYSDTVEVEVTIPQEIIWDNYPHLNSGEKMVLILSDWTVLWLFATTLISSVLGYRFSSGAIGLTSLAGLTLVGWVLAFVPDYVTLSLMIFYIFIGFLFEWQINVSS